MIVKTDAIVLRARKLRETSRFLTLYTSAFGKIDAVAKGVRQQNSKIRGVLEPFSEISVVLYRKEQRSAQYLSDAESVQPRRTFQADYDRLSTAFAVAELTDTTMPHEERNPAMYSLLRDTLGALDGTSQRPGTVLIRFQLRLIQILGFGLQPEVCIVCAADLHHEAERWFVASAGGLRCGRCSGPGAGTNISSWAYTLLISNEKEGLAVSDIPESETPRAEHELRGMLNAYLLYHTDSTKVLRSSAMLSHAGRPV